MGVSTPFGVGVDTVSCRCAPVELADVALVDLQQTVEELDTSLSSIENVLDPEAKKAEIADLEEQVAAPNLWDDQENAQRVTSAGVRS